MMHPALMTDLSVPPQLKLLPGWNQGAFALVVRAIMHTSMLAWPTDEYVVDVYHALNVVDGLIQSGQYSLLEIMRDTVLSDTLPARSLVRY